MRITTKGLLVNSYSQNTRKKTTSAREKNSGNSENGAIRKRISFLHGFGLFHRKTATSLDSFEKTLQVVAADSVIFHFQRGDFRKWIEDTLGDQVLARRVGSIKPPFSAEELRKELLAIVQTRITQLKRWLPHYLRHMHS